MTLQEDLERYRSLAYSGLPPLSKVQEAETRQAFYAGAAVACMRLIEIQNMPELEAITALECLFKEAMAGCDQRLIEMQPKG